MKKKNWGRIKEFNLILTGWKKILMGDEVEKKERMKKNKRTLLCVLLPSNGMRGIVKRLSCMNMHKI